MDNIMTLQSTLKIIFQNGSSEALHNDHFKGKAFITEQLNKITEKIIKEMNTKVPGKNIKIKYNYDNNLKVTFQAEKTLTKEDKKKIVYTWRSWLEYLDMLILRKDKFHEKNGDDYLLMVLSDVSEA